ncbi:hypothetical protein D3C73_1666960 [compost metagenome]
MEIFHNGENGAYETQSLFLRKQAVVPEQQLIQSVSVHILHDQTGLVAVPEPVQECGDTRVAESV